MLADRDALAHRIESGAVEPRVLLMAGAFEESRSGYRTGGVAMTQTQVDQLIETTRMVDNTADLGAVLEHLNGHGAYRVKTVVFSDESHLSVIPASIARGLNFALSVDGDGLPPRLPEPERK